MPASPAQCCEAIGVADAFKISRGGKAEDLHEGWFAKCRNCGFGHHEHDPETETCPLPYDAQVGTGKYESAWECVVCSRRWEDHETVFEGADDAQTQAEEEDVRARGGRALARDTAG